MRSGGAATKSGSIKDMMKPLDCTRRNVLTVQGTA
jgi:hypothetical protein